MQRQTSNGIGGMDNQRPMGYNYPMGQMRPGAPMQGLHTSQAIQGMRPPMQMARPPVPNKRKRPTDKILAKKLEDYVPEAKLYNQMVEFEKKLDSTITRKILDLQDSLAKPEVISF